MSSYVDSLCIDKIWLSKLRRLVVDWLSNIELDIGTCMTVGMTWLMISWLESILEAYFFIIEHAFLSRCTWKWKVELTC